MPVLSRIGGYGWESTAGATSPLLFRAGRNAASVTVKVHAGRGFRLDFQGVRNP